MLLQLSEEKKDLAKAICVADWSWTWCSDDADFHWIEDEALAAAREKTGTSVDCTVFKPFSTELFDKCE